MALILYLARHAEASNPRGILYGRLPRVDLSENGRQQAEGLADALAELRLAAIYTSPLLRARRTAAAIGRRHPGVPLQVSALLLENRHPYQGRSQKEVAQLGDRVYDPDVLGADGESIADLRDRLVRFMLMTARKYPDMAVAAVAHADPIAAFRAHLLGKELRPASLREETPPPAAVFRIVLNDDGSTQLDWHWKPAPPANAQPPQNEAPSADARTASDAEVSQATRACTADVS